VPEWRQSAHYDFDERVLLDDERMVAELHNQVSPGTTAVGRR
jgi:hypothetical protein